MHPLLLAGFWLCKTQWVEGQVADGLFPGLREELKKQLSILILFFSSLSSTVCVGIEKREAVRGIGGARLVAGVLVVDFAVWFCLVPYVLNIWLCPKSLLLPGEKKAKVHPGSGCAGVTGAFLSRKSFDVYTP